MKTGSKLSEDEIQLYNAFVASKKAQPVAVDLETGTKLKNQVGKPVDKVTLRYVFQKFEEFLVLVCEDGYRIFDILNEQQNKILELLGRNYQKVYGL